ncbi:MAG: hypothetical protein JRN06_03090 [Nitrososphaerota archaeon]|nr:hypothetical protein [Nitrososphaerota archaeon]MDG7023156.1 hypothetical protein [Nitrososphaerota archaeon]
MGLDRTKTRHRGASLTAVVFILAVLMAASVPAAASVYDYVYSSNTGTVRAPTVTLGTGTAGTSSISSVAPDAATVAVTAGLVFYESANADTSCTSPSPDTALTAPGTSGSITFNKGTTACLWSAQLTAGSTLYALNWVTDFWLSADAAKFGINVVVYVTDSAGTHQGSAIFSGTTSAIATKNVMQELRDTFVGVAATVPANGYIELILTPPSAGGTPKSWTIYWGAGQLTNFATPSNYNYVLAITNGAAATWSVSLGVASSSLLTRLSNFTISLATTPVNKQVIIAGGSVTQSGGTAVTLGATGTLNIAVGGVGNAIPTGSNTPSVVTVSLKVLSSSSTVFAQYTILFSVY